MESPKADNSSTTDKPPWNVYTSVIVKHSSRSGHLSNGHECPQCVRYSETRLVYFQFYLL